MRLEEAVNAYGRIDPVERISFIEPSGDGLEPLRAHLADVAKCRRFRSVDEAVTSGAEADFVLLLADRDPHKLRNEIAQLRDSPLLSSVPRIVFLPSGTTDFAAKSAGIDGEVVFTMPIDRTAVLSRLVTMQKRAHRRVFEILIGLQPEGSSARFFGKSLDFSQSGVAFECGEQFAEGQKMIVTFVNPATKKRFALDVEVVRKKLRTDGTESSYGARFSRLAEEDHRDLMDFIAGGK